MPLVSLYEENLSLGAFPRANRESIPPGGTYSISNGFLEDGPGGIFKRGGTTYKSNASFGDWLQWVGEESLIGGDRTVFVSNNGAFGVLDVDDASPVNLTTAAANGNLAGRPVVIGGIMFLPRGSNNMTIYGGSRKTATYLTGSIDVVNGSAIVAGTGTSFSANVDPGMILTPGAAAGYQRSYVVKTVDSNTQLTLTEQYRGATATVFYRLDPYREFQMAFTHDESVFPADLKLSATVVGTFAGRLLIGGSSPQLSAGMVRFSGSNIDDAGAASGLATIDDEDYHRLPGGAVVTGIDALRGTTLVFSSRGLFGIYGLENPLVDLSGNQQQRLEPLNPDLILWGEFGIATAPGGLVVPAMDGVWLMDSAGTPRRISQQIDNVYRGYINAVCRPGGACVYRGHYFLPILFGTDVIDVLVCRLDQNQAWSQLTGSGANVQAFAVRARGGVSAPALYGAGGQTSGAAQARVLNCSSYFAPDPTVKNDHDGTAVTGPNITFRDIPVGKNNRLGIVKKVRVRYSLQDSNSGDDPTMAVTVNGVSAGTAAAETSTAAASGPYGEPVTSVATWRPTGTHLRARTARVTVAFSSRSADARVKGLELEVRQSGKD